VNIQKIVEREILNLPVRLVNLPKHKELEVSRDTVSVIVTGAESLVKEMTPDEIKVIVDCSRVKRKQKIKLPVQIKLPKKINLKQAKPDSIEVFLK